MSLPLIDLAKEIADWTSARYGKQVRAATVSALTKIQQQMNTAIEFIDGKGTEIEATIQEVNAVKDEAEQAVTDAQGYASDAAESASAAAGSEADAADRVLEAESWAHGNTGVRPGENTDNSKFWSQQSQLQAQAAENSAALAAQYSTIIAPGFFLDVESGTLYMKAGVGVDFIIDTDTTELYWKVTAA